MADIPSAIIGEGGSLLGSVVQGLFNNYASKKQYQRQRDLMKYQNDLNLANWQLQNDYNSPKNQLARLREAGINPDMFYGQNATSAMGADLPSVSGGSASPSSPITTDFGQSTMQASLMDAQRDMLESVANKNNADANNTNAMTPWIPKRMQSELDLNEKQAKVLNESVEKIRNESELKRLQFKIAERTNDYEEILFNHRVTEEIERLGASAEQSRVIAKNFARLYVAQINNLIAQGYASYVNADANRTNANANMYNAKTNRMEYGLHKVQGNKQLSLREAEIQFNKSLREAGINLDERKTEVLELQNQWRMMLNDVPYIGEALHGILSIPVSALSGVF